MSSEKRKDSNKRVLKEGEYQRANGTFEYRYRDKTGKRFSVYAKTLKELRLKEKDIVKKNIFGIKNNNLTVNELYKKWLNSKRGLKQNTLNSYKDFYKNHLADTFGNVKIENVENSDITAFYIRLIEKDKLTPSTVSSIHIVLSQILEIAVKNRYILKNPTDKAFDGIKRIYKDKTLVRKALTKDEERIFVDYLNNEKKVKIWRQFFLCLLYTGMRIGELSSLTWNDIDFEQGIISVNHTQGYFKKQGSSSKTISIGSTKSASGTRNIPLTEKVKKILLDEKQLQMTMGLHSNAVIDGYKNFIFIGRSGNPRLHDSYSVALKKIIKACNNKQIQKGEDIQLSNFTAHSLRHTFATRLCEANVNPKVIQSILGHAKIETTMEIYASVGQETQQKEIENFFKNNKAINQD